MHRKSLTGSLLSTVVAVGIPVAIVVFTGPSSTTPPPTLHASTTGIGEVLDDDNDGLGNGQELVLGTDPTKSDTDGDGFADLEEFARHSDPLAIDSVPTDRSVSVALSARGEGGLNYVFTAIYSADGNFQGKNMALGVATAGRLVRFRNRGVSPLHHALVPVSGAGVVLTVDRPIRTRRVARLGYLSYFGAIGEAGTGSRFSAAATADLQSIEGFTVLARTNFAFADGGGPSGLAPLQTAGSRSNQTPIPAGGEMPTDWTAGAACVQQSSTVGSTGPVLTQEVTSATCEDGWDSFCSSGCADTAGSTFDTVDPVALVGG